MRVSAATKKTGEVPIPRSDNGGCRNPLNVAEDDELKFRPFDKETTAKKKKKKKTNRLETVDGFDRQLTVVLLARNSRKHRAQRRAGLFTFFLRACRARGVVHRNRKTDQVQRSSMLKFTLARHETNQARESISIAEKRQ
ncbi:hypothetical protein PUN28_004040 [Cardiocondyla obscurior]|uniref:Uncharacterized protein n=1 Tax=Cardiocondyla obscurior TaxID=286306 RepID=A0AAW2GMS9_9HYME